MVIRSSLFHIVAAALGAACLAGSPIGGPARAADLGYHYLPPSPCAQYEVAFRETLASMRATARVFRAHQRRFNWLKRRRHNDGFYGPDISLNAEMTAEQIDIANKAAFVTETVYRARQLNCSARGRLNAADNEAFRIDREIAQGAIWTDPRTFW